MSREKLIDFEKYDVYKDGTIFSKHWNRTITGTMRNGYLRVRLFTKSGEVMSFTLHRVIWYYFNGDIPDGMQVNHIDECKTNNALSNLNLMTPKENVNWGTHNQRVSQKLSSRIISECTRKKISASLNGRVFTEEWKDNLSKAHKGKISPKRKKVVQFDAVTGDIIERYASTYEAAKITGFTQGCIAAACRGDYFGGNNYKDYCWRYED